MANKGYQTVGKPLPHESAHLHVTGSAQYTDDIPEINASLHGALGTSTRAHARIVSMDLSAVMAAPGVAAVVTLDDITGEKYVGPYLHDEPVFADGIVEYLGQPLFAVAATSHDLARRAARLVRVEYEDLDPVLTVDEGADRKSYVLPPVHISRGDPQAVLAAGPNRHQGEVRAGGQEQFYLEGQVAYAWPGENDEMQVYCSTQHPSEMQHTVARVLGQEAHTVKVQCRRMGGGFGGKESQSWPFVVAAALLARCTGRPVKLRADRDDDFMITGKRHDFHVFYDVAYTDEGLIKAITFEQRLRCGYSADLSGAVGDRQVFHTDNAYYLETFDILSLRVKTNTQSNTAFRGFGGPQGILGIEYVIDDIARRLGKDPLDVRKLNFYGRTERNVTPYRMVVEDNVVHELVDQLEASSKYRERRKQIDRFNAQSRVLKKGLALVPVKFGISFTATHLNQAGALLHIYTDGSVLINHGGTEMGQGLNTKVAQVVAYDLSAQMLAVVSQAAVEKGFNNIQVQQGVAESLPFEDASFDLVVSRYSAHHWSDLNAALSEARRVLSRGSRVIFMDVIAPETPVLDTWLQALELLRDPSHVRDYSASEWLGALRAAGFHPGPVTRRRLRLEFTSWVERMNTPKLHADAIRSLETMASADVQAHYEIEADGSFSIDTATFEATC